MAGQAEELLHRVVSACWPTFRERAENAGGLPGFVVDEVEGYLRCGIRARLPVARTTELDTKRRVDRGQLCGQRTRVLRPHHARSQIPRERLARAARVEERLNPRANYAMVISYERAPSMATFTITLSEPLQRYLERKLADSGCRSESEYVQELLEAEQREEEELDAWERLRQKVEEGLASGPPIPATDELWSDLRAELAERRSQASR